MSNKTFTGSYCLLLILLCCGIVPGIIYYFIARKEIQPQTVIQISNQNIQEEKK